MADTILLDTSLTGSHLDGTKTLAQLGLTADAASTISGGKLNVNSTSGNWNGVTLGNTIFDTMEADIDASTMTGNVAVVSRLQANGDCFIVLIQPNGDAYFYTITGGALVQFPIGFVEPGQSLTAGPMHIKNTVKQNACGTFDMTCIITAGAATTSFHSLANKGGLTAGAFGVGMKGGAGSFSAIKMTSSDLPNSAITGVNLMVGLSDSIGFGFGTTNPPDTSHINLDGVALGANWTFLNLAIPGQTFAQARAKAAHISFGGMAFTGHKVLLVAEGTNDLNTGTTPAALITDFNSEFAASKSAGYTDIVLTTLTPRASAQAAIDTANASIKGAATTANKVVDYTANPHLTNPADTTYFQDDALHLTDAGEQARSTSDMAVFSAAFSATVPVTNPYDSPPSNEVMVTPGYVPLAPVITSFSGLSTFPNAQVKLTWSAGNWGDIEVQRLTVGAAGAAGVFATIATLNPVTPGDRTTVPLTFTDTAVVFGVPYKYRLIAQGTE